MHLRYMALAGAIVLAFAMRVPANACEVRPLPQPAKAQLTLPLHTEGLNVSGAATLRVQPDEVYVQLALLALQPGQQLTQSICGATPLVRGGVVDATPRDLAHVTTALTAAGIPPSAITTRLSTPPFSPWSADYQPAPVKIGQILVRVKPLTSSHLQKVLNDIATAWRKTDGNTCTTDSPECRKAEADRWLGESPLELADLVVRRDNCAVRERALNAALSDAHSRAQAFSGALGLRLGGAIVTHFEANDLPWPDRNEYICGNEQPSLPFASDGALVYAALGLKPVTVPQFKSAYAGAAVYTAINQPRISAASTGSTPYGVSSDSPDWLKIEEPFVSAHGKNTVIAPADALLLIARSDADTSHPDVAHDAVDALLRSGTARRDILLRDGLLYARITPVSDASAQRAVESIRSISGLFAWIEPVVRNCPPFEAKAEQGAMYNALQRAKIVAAAAGAKTGAFIAAQQNAYTHEALCGGDSRNSVRELAALAITQPALAPSGTDDYAEFFDVIRVAWRLEPGPEYTSPSYTRDLDAFAGGFFSLNPGSVNETKDKFTVDNPQQCQAKGFTALATTVKQGLQQAKIDRPYALIDEGSEDPYDPPHCWIDERVVVVK